MLYGYTNPFISATKVAAAQKYFYESGEAVLADPKNTVEGLRVGINLFADRMVDQLSDGQAGR